MTTLFVTAYLTVLIAELVGDKTLYTLGTLSAKYRALPIMLGASAAFACKMAVAVSFGALLATLPQGIMIAVSASTFAFMAVAFVLDGKKGAPVEAEAPTSFGHAVLASFVAILLPEWGDPGQLAAAALSATHHTPLVVFFAAVLAMITKASLASWLGAGLRRFVPRVTMRYVSAALCLTMALLTMFRVEL
jgi:putative Ca2+/H+ antiporter (TMEM165/GDT1 family)